MQAAIGGDKRFNFGLDFQFKPDNLSASRRSGEKRFRILLLADLSGRAQRGIQDASDLGARPCLRVDLDEFDSILMKYAPRIEWPIGPVTVTELDDFHPDQLYRNLEVFKTLRATRKKLKDPSSFSDTARQLRAEKHIEPSVKESPQDTADDDDVFNRLLGRPLETSQSAQPAPPSDTLASLIQQIVAPYIVPETDPQLTQYIASVDMAIGDQMRAILHHRDFQALETVWRGIWDLVTSLELSESLELDLLDVTKGELLDDLRRHKADLAASGLHRQWIDRAIGTPGGHPWSLLVGHYHFGANDDDIELLAGLGLLASRAGAPFMADAHASLLGCASASQYLEPSEWAAAHPMFAELRKSPAASWIGLTVPRILTRLPYGQRSDEIDSFMFEELGGEPDHEHFLWGSSALACAKLLGLAFQAQGWAFTPESSLDLEDLPAYIILSEDGKKPQPAAEIVMSDRIGDEISRRGLMALMSYRNRNAVRVQNLQSVSDPPTRLSGPWAG